MTAQQKLHILSEVHAGGKTQEEIAAAYGISRVTLHNWKKQLLSRGTLEAAYKRGDDHYKTLDQSSTEAILTAISTHPDYSVAQLYIYCNDVLSLGVGYGTIQAILERYNLTHTSDRILYAAQYPQKSDVHSSVESTAEIVTPANQLTPSVMPAPPPEIVRYPRLSSLLPPLPFSRETFEQNFTLSFFLSIFFGAIVSFLLTNLVFGITLVASLGQMIGIVFAFGALLFGSFFFVYSLKYYWSVIKVILFSRNSSSSVAAENKSKRFKPGLLSNVSDIELSRHPFISIHLPLYNEKRVVNRLLEAVTSLTYDNYEVIVCDDSTDETTNLVMEWQNHPKVKISHRENRDGYKGGALKKALTLMDERTEFVMVFDADFLPYPDTIEQFLKYFKVSGYEFDPELRTQNPNPNNSLTQQSQPAPSSVAAVQGYQWHVLNKSENWVTRGVRTEYAGSYVIERSGTEVYGGLKQIAGSVFMIRADILRDEKYMWGRSITEDFELTLKLYRDGYKVVYTPYIQAPSECVSTLKRLIRQRMRWAEGHSFNIKKHFWEVLKSRHTGFSEKLEFVYLSPYYLQSFFFVLGTVCWFSSEVIFRVRLPLWTAVWGWSLVLTNIISLPLMNTVGLFLEEAEGKDYSGIPSFLLLSYILAPFQAYAAVKGFVESEEGPWFRTPKTGRITDTLTRGKFYHWLSRLFSPRAAGQMASQALVSSLQQALSPIPKEEALVVPKLQFNLSFGSGSSYRSLSRRARFISRTFLLLLLIVTLSLTSLPRAVPSAQATNPSDTKWYVREEQMIANDDAGPPQARAIDCPATDNCKIVYDDFTTSVTYFFDCDDATCTTGTRTQIDNQTDNGSLSIDCPTSSDCKVVMESNATGITFLDCANETCSSNSQVYIDGDTPCTLTGCDTARNADNNASLYCPAADDCKVAYKDQGNTAVRFADCDDATCSTGTTTLIDGAASCALTGCNTGDTLGAYLNLFCVSTSDCKMIYEDDTLGSGLGLRFSDCDNATCTSGNARTLDGGTGCTLTNCSTTDLTGLLGSIDCPATDDCKISYYNLTNTDLKVADCSTASCSAGTITKADGGTSCTLTNCTTTDTGGYTSIKCLSQTSCKIAYYNNANGDLYFADCTQSSVMCDGGTSSKLDGGSSCLLTNCSTTDKTGEQTSIDCISGTDCKIRYYKSTDGGDVVFADCDSATCNSGTKITIDGNKLINATAGSIVTTRTFGTASETFTYVSDVSYPSGFADGSLASGTYSLNLRFTNAITSGTLTWNYEVGYCTVLSDCTSRTTHATSANQSYTSATTSPQTVTATAGSTISLPAPTKTKWLYIKFTVVSAATGLLTIRMNRNAANTADTYIDMPTLSVPELIMILLPLGLIMPLVVIHMRKRRRKYKALATREYSMSEFPQKLRRMWHDTGPPG